MLNHAPTRGDTHGSRGMTYKRDRQAFWWRPKLLLLLSSMLGGLACAEAALRLIDYSPGELALFRENPSGAGSYRLRPNLDIGTKFGTRDIRIKTNAHGMRWRDVSEGKRAGTKRVAFVGDSFTFGLWADSVEQSLVGVFDALVAPRGAEALNFGSPGYGLADIELQIREQVLRFRPDTIVLMLYNGNDLLDTYLGLRRYAVSSGGVLVANGQVLEEKIPENFRRGSRSFQRSLTERLYLTRTLKAAIIAWFPQDKSDDTLTTIRDTSYTSNLFWSRRDYPDFAVKAKDMTLDALARILRLCRQHDVELRIAAIPSMEQVRFPADFSRDYRRDLPQGYVAEFAQTHALAFLDLLPGLNRHAQESGEVIYWAADGHFNNNGHRVAATLLSAW